MSAVRPMIAIAFDGVVHIPAKGSKPGEVTGTITPGFFEWMEQMRDHFELVLFSTYATTDTHIMDMTMWLGKARNAWIQAGGRRDLTQPLTIGIKDFIPGEAKVVISAEAVRFNGDWSAKELSPEAIFHFKPWHSQRRG